MDNSFNVTYGDQLDWDLGDELSSRFFTAGVRSNWQTQEGLRQTGDLQANDNGTASVIIAEDKTFISTSKRCNHPEWGSLVLNPTLL